MEDPAICVSDAPDSVTDDTALVQMNVALAKHHSLSERKGQNTAKAGTQKKKRNGYNGQMKKNVQSDAKTDLKTMKESERNWANTANHVGSYAKQGASVHGGDYISGHTGHAKVTGGNEDSVLGGEAEEMERIEKEEAIEKDEKMKAKHQKLVEKLQ